MLFTLMLVDAGPVGTNEATQGVYYLLNDVHLQSYQYNESAIPPFHFDILNITPA